MSAIRNVLFIMCDQLRADYMSCAGHPRLQTPNLDRLARRGVLFTHAYAQSPVCLPSRMSFYTGRYVISHGATWNVVPLSLDERGFGEFLRAKGIRVALVGKTHMIADVEGMRRLGVDPGSGGSRLLLQCGFEPIERDDGLHPDQSVDPALRYNEYLRGRGYEGHNPWHEFANAGRDESGALRSGWYLRNATFRAAVAEADSETPYMTRRAIDFIESMDDRPWLLHLSYIKPHWPYIAPAPYDRMYSPDDCLPIRRTEGELVDPHPVFRAYMNTDAGRSFRLDATCRTIVPVYMGLVRQIDDHLGRLFDVLERKGRFEDTLIVFTSDHGDYLGDHWLGEKELFHDAAARIPLIVFDPSRSADSTRGTKEQRLVESIDLAPTFLEALGVDIPTHRFEGRSLLPLIRGASPENWREAAYSELDYGFRPVRYELGRRSDECRGYMVRTERWKYVHFSGFRPMLFDLAEDPWEYRDLGASPEHGDTRAGLTALLCNWFASRKNRITMTAEDVERASFTDYRDGIIYGVL